MKNGLTSHTYLEVYEILNKLGTNYINKIPRKVYQDICEKKMSETEEKVHISKEAITFIAILHYKYWTTSLDEKRELIEIFTENEEKNKIKMNNLFNENTQDDEEEKEDYNLKKHQEKALVEYKKEKFYVKIINFIKEMFFRRYK